MPAYSHDLLDRSLLFDRLYRPFLGAAVPFDRWQLCRWEHDALIRGDVPYFVTTASSVRIAEAGNRGRVAAVNAITPIAHAHRSLRATVADDDEEGTSIIKSSFEAAAWPRIAVRRVAIDLPKRRSRRDAASWRLRHELAAELFTMMRRTTIVSKADDTLAIIGASLQESGRTQQVGLCQSTDTYSGIAGIGLLAAALARCRPEVRSRRLAERAAETLVHAGEVHRRSSSDRLGAFSGASAVAFALAKIGELLEERIYVDLAARLWITSRPQSGAALQNYDVISGVAGTAMVGCCSAFSQVEVPELRELLSLHLAELREAALGHPDDGSCWWPVPGLETGASGFAHGVAGVAAALARLHALAIGDAKNLVSAALTRERASYDWRSSGWPIMKADTGTHSPGAGWCYGGPGVLLAVTDAVAAKIPVDADLTHKAVEATLAAEPDGDGLCHGRAGVAMVELRAGRLLSDNALEHAGRRRLDALALRAWSDIELRLEPVSSLRHATGLMCGAAGVALALIAPEVGPSTVDLLAIA
jgi:lantibiotic modifying enzyme